MTPFTALTIAGSDSGGCAGIQADLTTMAALGVHGMSVITVVTAQNTVGVQELHPLPDAVVAQQLTSVRQDLPPDAVKCGLLGTPELVDLVAKAVADGLPAPVVDPVLVATSGDGLTTGDVISAYTDLLLPSTLLLTPNADEASALLGGGAVDTVDDRREAARALLAMGPAAVVVTGGTERGVCTDVYADADGLSEHSAPAIETTNDHGTGCTYSAAVAAQLARGADLADACCKATSFVRAQLTTSREWRLGAGHGPVAHVIGSVAPTP